MTQEIVSDSTPIQDFYSGANVLITGATGFLGKILLEKLLRSCPDLGSVYIIVRNKKGKNLHARIDDLFDDVIFDRLKTEAPKFRHKVVGVSGDCMLPELGINQQDRQLLINEISVIFHVAATVRFDEKLKLALAINVRSIQDLLTLSRQMKNLKSLIHVSTAYSNVPHQTIEEKFYQMPVDSKKLVLLSESVSDKMLENITPTILGKWPNTYAFTKAVAEDIVRQEGCDLPVGVFRPAIVVSTYREPIKAWINNLYGPTGVCAGAGTGVLRALHADSAVNANIVPVDMCVNALIATAQEVGANFEKNKSQEIPIYNFESSNDRPINWGEFMHLSESYGINTPSIKSIWYYSFDIYKNYYVYLMAIMLLHYVPAICMDLGLLCMGKSPKMIKIYKKVHKFTDVISYFSTRSWTFKSDRVRNMINRMSAKDRELFFCDLSKLDWNEFFMTYCTGIRIYLIQDPMDTLEEAVARFRKLYWCHQAVKAVILYILVRCFWSLFNSIYSQY